MSDIQLMKLREESSALQRELRSLKSALPPGDAANQLHESISRGGDPLTSDNSKENDWVSAPTSGPCCVVQ
jgi:hypothetical protein